MIKKYLVKKSKIHGKGVFANKEIKKKELILEYRGRKITKKESDKIGQETLEFAKSNPGFGEVYIFKDPEIHLQSLVCR